MQDLGEEQDHDDRPDNGERPDQEEERPVKRRKRTSMAELVRTEVAKAFENMNASQQLSTRASPTGPVAAAGPTESVRVAPPSLSNANTSACRPVETAASVLSTNASVVAPIPSSPSLNSLERSVQAMLAPDQGMISTSVSNITNFDLPLGSNLSEKLRSKVIAGEYVDLFTILNPSLNEEIMGLNIGFNDTQG